MHQAHHALKDNQAGVNCHFVTQLQCVPQETNDLYCAAHYVIGNYIKLLIHTWTE